MYVNLPGHHGHREHHVLRRALACCSTLAAVTAMACASATFASAATRAHPARPGPVRLAAHLQSAADDVTFPVFDVQLTNGVDNLCLDAENDSGGNPSEAGDKVQLWTCNSGAANQRWDLTMYGDPYDGYSSGVIDNEDGGLCLSAGGSAGDAVQMGSCSYDDREQNTWVPFQLSDGSFEFYNLYNGLAITAEDDSGGNPNDCGDNIQVQDSAAAASQQWTIDGPTTQCS